MNLNEISKIIIINKIVVQIVDGTKLIPICTRESGITKIRYWWSAKITSQDKRFNYML